MIEKVTFTCVTNTDGLLTKTIQPDGKGGIIKTPAAHLTQGVTEKVKMPFQELGQYFRTLKANQAICHGVCSYDRADVVAVSRFKEQPKTVARTKEYFCYPEGSGLGMFDHDPKPGQKAMASDEFKKIIARIWPDFRQLPTIWTPSTSSCIYDMDGEPLNGKGSGWHMYFPFYPANKLPEFASWLFKKCWLAGHGYIFVSRSGALLERTIFDAAVFSPERLDFVAGAHCINCSQQLPEPVFEAGAAVEEVA